MKRSSGPRKTASNLSESVHQRLNMYAIAAGAAGVGMLAVAQPAEARVIYTWANTPIGRFIYLDLNHDGINDVAINFIENSFHKYTFLFVAFSTRMQPSNRVVVVESRNAPRAAALPGGSKVGPHSPFNPNSPSYIVMAQRTALSSTIHTWGPWAKVRQAYLGFKFVIKGKVHYGWARIRMTGVYLEAVLTGYAYETIANKAIVTWPMGPKTNNVEESDFGPGASLTSPIPAKHQPASLGMLALGAPGVSLWRRKENESAPKGE